MRTEPHRARARNVKNAVLDYTPMSPLAVTAKATQSTTSSESDTTTSLINFEQRQFLEIANRLPTLITLPRGEHRAATHPIRSLHITGADNGIYVNTEGLFVCNEDKAALHDITIQMSDTLSRSTNDEVCLCASQSGTAIVLTMVPY